MEWIPTESTYRLACGVCCLAITVRYTIDATSITLANAASDAVSADDTPTSGTSFSILATIPWPLAA